MVQGFTHCVTHVLSFVVGHHQLSPLPLQGTAAVAAVLAGNHSIYTLSLAGCPLRDEGAMALAEALKTNISLYKLDLSNCLVSHVPSLIAS